LLLLELLVLSLLVSPPCIFYLLRRYCIISLYCCS